MAIAHVCQRCGLDLARRHPIREPHYNLSVIICTCGQASTRTVHPIWRGWQWATRLNAAILAIAFQVVAIVVFTTLHLLSGAWIGYMFWRDQPVEYLQSTGWWSIWPLVILPLAIGTWLRAALGHWRYATQWIGWLGLLFATVTFIMIVLPAFMELSYRFGVTSSMPQETVQELFPLWTRTLIGLAILTGVSLIGWPLGTAFVHYNNRRRHLRWQRRRRRRRARRLST